MSAKSMLPLAITQRELIVAAKSKTMYRRRFTAALLVFVTAALLILATRPFASSTTTGSALFTAMLWLGFFFAFLEGPRTTADCLSQEKRDGTLELLFLTDLRSWEVVAGKLTAAILPSFYMLLASFPVYCIALLFGGVTSRELVRAAATLLATLFFSTSISIFTSALFRELRHTLAAAAALLVLFSAAAVFSTAKVPAHAFSVSPVSALLLVRSGSSSLAAGEFWLTIAVISVFSGVFLALSAWALPRALSAESKRSSSRPARTSKSSRRHADSIRPLLDANPVVWICQRTHRNWVSMLLVLGIGLAYGPSLILLSNDSGNNTRMALFPLIAISASLVQILIKLMVAFYAVKFFCDAKRNGALELLLSTPLTEQEFARGQFLSLARIFAWPVIVGSTLGIATALTRLPFQPQPFAARPYFFAMTVLVIGDLIALAWVGMWMGFRSNGTMAAATRTIVIVLIAPWFLITAATPMLVMSPVIMAAFGTKFLLFQPFFLLLKDLLLIAWARGNLFQKLRDRPAPPPFDNPPPQIPLAPPAAVPPVINSR